MFEKYTEKARRVIFFARYEAGNFGSSEIDSEHLLLGIARECSELFQSLGLAPEDIQCRIREHAPVGEKTIPTSADLPFSAAAIAALEAAAVASEQSGRRHIGPEHLLLGLLRQESSLAARILANAGVMFEGARQNLLLIPAESSAAYDWPKVTGRAVPDDGFRRAVSDALEEASLLFRMSAAPEHLLLGLMRNPRSRAAQILKEHGLDLQGLREKLKQK
jgi:ATP-dependent Clp protease ATP-binding subunit ClpC